MDQTARTKMTEYATSVAQVELGMCVDENPPSAHAVADSMEVDAEHDHATVLVDIDGLLDEVAHVSLQPTAVVEEGDTLREYTEDSSSGGFSERICEAVHRRDWDQVKAQLEKCDDDIERKRKARASNLGHGGWTLLSCPVARRI